MNSDNTESSNTISLDMPVNYIEGSFLVQGESAPTIRIAELVRLSLNPGDVLGVKITSNDIDENSLSVLKQQLEHLFPNNKIMLFCMPPNSDISFTAIQGTQKTGCGPKACADCSCGKKEALDELQKETEELVKSGMEWK